MRSPMLNTEFYVPDSILTAMNGVEFVARKIDALYARLLTPRVLQSINGLTTYSTALVETIWTQLPSFSRQALQLIYLDFSKLFAGYALLWMANNRYAAYEAQLPIALSYLVAGVLTFFQYTLFLMAWLQKPQSWIHSSVLLLKLPDEWQRMPKVGVPKLDVSSCISCNKLREIKGDIRSAVLYCFQQLVLSGVRLLPLGTVLSFLPHILMTGRMLAEYRYRTEGVCDRHIEKTYQQNWEFFAILGFCHFFGVALSNMILGSGMSIPSDAFEPCVSGLMMLALVRLTYGMKDFPRPVEHAIRAFPIPDPTRWVVESSIDFMAFKFKQNLKDPNMTLALLDCGSRKVTQFQAFFSLLQTHYQKTVKTHHVFSYLPLASFLPSMLRKSDHFFEDPIVGQWCLDQLNNWKNALGSLLNYRKLMLQVMTIVEPINQVRQHLPIRIFLFCFGGVAGTINDIFTVDFVINRCPGYIREAIESIPTLRRFKILNENTSQQFQSILRKLATNLEVVRRILSELPESSRVELFNLLKDERFEKYLLSTIKSLHSILVERAYGFDLLDEEKPEEEDKCEFPEEEVVVPRNGGRLSLASATASAAFFAVPPLPKASSMDEWDD